ncbi:hypothetical protein [Chitinophaga costaii]
MKFETDYLPAAALPAAAVVFFTCFAGLTLPKDPLKILPFLVFTSPLPMIIFVCSFYLRLALNAAFRLQNND